MAAIPGPEENASGTAPDTSSGAPADQEADATLLPDANPSPGTAADEADATLLPGESSPSDASLGADATLLPGESSPSDASLGADATLLPGESSPPDSDAEPAAPQFASPEFAAPQFAAPEPAGPPGVDSAQAQPGRMSVFDRHRTLVVLSAVAALVLVAVIAVVATALVSNASSTASVRVITPAPTKVDGLARDFPDEARAQFQSVLAQFRQRFAGVLKHVSSYTAAIYTNAPPGSSPTSATVAVFYAGFNIVGPSFDPSGAVKAAVSGMRLGAPFSSTFTVTGLPGDTNAECVGGTANGNPVSACVWATDNTASFLVSLLPATNAELAIVLKEMRPYVQRG
jgi:hypothetical protein